ncbi:MAG TPA: SDR family NAD(P)-dependent oxidoreductase [Acidimicrobiales bacterium]|nr:SDR family NAD(P)-dependent oxidoreductase [Acidimicrobiales bacterium]
MGPDPSAARLAGKTAIIVGAGQTPGATIGNGRATAVLFARNGAEVLVVDRDEGSAEETASMIREEGGKATVHVSDIASETACSALADVATRTFHGRVDILHNNVGIGAGDATPTRLTEDAWDAIIDVNLKAMWLTCKHVVPVMREQGAGSITCVSSVASVAAAGNLTAYKVSKAGVNALVQALASTNARHGVRVNAILPGLIDTPMAVDAVARASGVSREEVASVRASRVPMKRQGTAWDVAQAAVYLSSDEAAFVTGVLLPVDGGQCTMVG